MDELRFYILLFLLFILFGIWIFFFGIRAGKYLLSDKELYRMKKLADAGIDPFTGKDIDDGEKTGSLHD